MIDLVFVEPEGIVRLLQVQPTGSLMQAARLAGIRGVVAECGGGCSCGTCEIIVDALWMHKLPPPDDAEADMLSLSSNLEKGSRLACQIRLTGELSGLRVTVPRV